MVKFIAEVSSNHSQDISRCRDFIDCAAEIGCHAVKFQLFKIDKLFAPEILEKSERHRTRKEWELPLDFLPLLADRCRQKNIELSCTPFYLDAVAELVQFVDFYKVASYELLWDDFLAACASTGKPLVVSTGMATMDEILHAVDVVKSNGCTNPILLHCTSAYPTPYTEANLSAIQTIRAATGCVVGWSDHTVDPGVIHRSVHKWGAETIEFHLDLEGKGAEFEAGHCWLPQEIAEVIEQVKHGYEADGDGVKAPVTSEANDREWRADPSDGLRPLKSVRASFRP